MIRYNIINPMTSRPTIGDSESLSNFAIIVPKNVFRSARNTAMLDIHVRQAIQDRPYHYFMGSAEHLMLDPLAKVISEGGDPINFMLQLAKDTNAVSKGLSLMRSKIGISTIGQVYSTLLPSTSDADRYLRPGANDKGEPKSGLSVFTSYFMDLWTSHSARETIFQTFKSPNPTIFPKAKPIIGNPSLNAIQTIFQSFEIFGMAGKRQPLFGSEIEPVMARRFAIEHYLFSSPNVDRKGAEIKLKNYNEDLRVSAAIWYLMYDQIVKTPESYDAAMPVVPTTPQDSLIAAQIFKMLGTFTQTSIAASTAPLYMDAIITIRGFSEMLEFLSTGPIHDEEAITKTKRIISECQEMISEAAYAPVISLANATYDYVKKLTGARYLLPEWVTTTESVNGDMPFSRMELPTAIELPKRFNGSIKGMQRITEFGGLDIPKIVEDLKRRASQAQAGLIQLSHLRTTLQSGLATQYGGVITHLDSLGSMTQDPALGTFEYPTPTKVYITPSYIPKYTTLDNGSSEWCFASGNYLYKPFFPNAYQYAAIQTNAGRQSFAWDTEVNLPPSPATGSDYACLLVPHNYVADCSSKSIANTIASVGQQLAASPHHPMGQVADYFTPLFHALISGLNTPEVLANAVASMFTIYRRKKTATSAATFNSAAAWEVIKPQAYFIYGHPTSSFLEANAPWTKEEKFKCNREHVIMDKKGEFMLVLHRAIPNPTNLAYVPFTLAGGIKISLPVNAAVYANALKEINDSDYSNPDTFYEAMYSRLQQAQLENNLIRVTAWSPAFAMYPHFFITNRNVTSSAGTILSALPQMMQRLSLSSDEAAPYGGVLSYFHTPVIGFDPSDELEAITTQDISLDINSEIKKQSSKGVVNSPGTDLPHTQLNEDAQPMQEIKEVKAEVPSATGAKGSIEVSATSSPGTFNPTIEGKQVETRPVAPGAEEVAPETEEEKKKKSKPKGTQGDVPAGMTEEGSED